MKIEQIAICTWGVHSHLIWVYCTILVEAVSPQLTASVCRR